ncbi:MAG TPA: hypothetical protein VL475_07220 [Planctomycetaceae bacterium]|nr:hypothetical protein [Planctomycetaceae bacterium]
MWSDRCLIARAKNKLVPDAQTPRPCGFWRRAVISRSIKQPVASRTGTGANGLRLAGVLLPANLSDPSLTILGGRLRRILLRIAEAFSKMRAGTAVFPRDARSCHFGARMRVNSMLVFPRDARTLWRFPERCANSQMRASLKFRGDRVDFFQIPARDARSRDRPVRASAVTLADRRDDVIDHRI